jgi:hypothetical protein
MHNIPKCILDSRLRTNWDFMGLKLGLYVIYIKIPPLTVSKKRTATDGKIARFTHASRVR